MAGRVILLVNVLVLADGGSREQTRPNCPEIIVMRLYGVGIVTDCMIHSIFVRTCCIDQSYFIVMLIE